MPNGPVHDAATVMLAIAAPAAAFALGNPLTPSLVLGGGCLTGLLLEPDLDVDHGCYSMQVMRRIGGAPAAWIWRAFWWPYAKVIHHRSIYSHLPVLGTAIRLLYVAVPVFAIISLAHWSIPQVPPDAIWFAGGLVASDTLHIIMDVVHTAYVRRRHHRHHRRQVTTSRRGKP